MLDAFIHEPRIACFLMEIARIMVMKGAISRNAAFFNSHRMMRRYATEACIR